MAGSKRLGRVSPTHIKMTRNRDGIFRLISFHRSGHEYKPAYPCTCWRIIHHLRPYIFESNVWHLGAPGELHVFNVEGISAKEHALYTLVHIKRNASSSSFTEFGGPKRGPRI
jgi:hypothetical protein